jgi:putative spermidine/putrescine transport system permease protein
LVSVSSLGFFITPLLLGSPRNSLLSQAIALEIEHRLDWGHAGAMSLLLLTITLLAITLGGLALRRGRNRFVGSTVQS